MSPPPSLPPRAHRIPLRRQLMLAFALLSIGSTVIAALGVTSLASRQLHRDLRDKSIHYARQLQRQLEPVIAYNDHVSAQEAFDSLLEDRDVEGLGVYGETGALLEGRGAHPETLATTDGSISQSPGRMIALADIQTRDDHKGRLYVGLNTRSIDESVRHNAFLAAVITGAVALCAMAAAAAISRRIARRLERIADAAKLMAIGAGTLVPLEDFAQDSIGELALAFNSMVHEVNRLSQEHEQLVTTERDRLELLVAERTMALEQSREMFRLIAESTGAIPFTLDLTRGAFLYMGAQGIEKFQIPEEQWAQPGALDLVMPRETHAALRLLLDSCESGSFEFLADLYYPGGRLAEVRWSGKCEKTPQATILRGVMKDVTEFRRLSRELSAAQKLESVGRLAAGVAHEINTPVQFVADNVEFVTTSMAGIVNVLGVYRELKRAVDTSGDISEASLAAAQAESREDVPYLLQNLPPALNGASEGIKRIASIVRSIKQFAHPDQVHKCEADLNQAIQSTLVMARNEYKYVADVETDLGVLPPVNCHVGEISQVILNLVVNAAHAMSDFAQSRGGKGLLTIRSRAVGGEVEISIGDTGGGIPTSIQDKIFEPFFTTKEVGRGTGQGLAIARSIMVKHGGSLRFETELGKGTTFFIRLPIGTAKSEEHLAA